MRFPVPSDTRALSSTEPSPYRVSLPDQQVRERECGEDQYLHRERDDCDVPERRVEVHPENRREDDVCESLIVARPYLGCVPYRAILIQQGNPALSLNENPTVALRVIAFVYNWGIFRRI